SRTWPASTSAEASPRLRTMRACQSHLSMRWRSTSLGLILLLELCLQGGELGERRIRIRLLVLTAAAERLGVILVALGAVALRAALRARRARPALLALGPLALPLGALAAFLPVAASLAVRTICALLMMWTVALHIRRRSSTGFGRTGRR